MDVVRIEGEVVNLVSKKKKKQGTSLLNKISCVVIILFLSKENNTGDTWPRISKLCVLPSLRCYQRKGTLAMKAVMLSPFPQELTALISWGKVHKEKNNVIQYSLEWEKHPMELALLL